MTTIINSRGAIAAAVIAALLSIGGTAVASASSSTPAATANTKSAVTSAPSMHLIIRPAVAPCPRQPCRFIPADETDFTW